MPARIKSLDTPPKTKKGLPESPKFLRRTERVYYGKNGKWKALWLCRCGIEFESFIDNVIKRHTVSCGCAQEAASHNSYPKHGHFIGDKPSPTYKSWQAMIARCTNPKHPAYKHYAGKGVTIIERWLKSFPDFLKDVGERPAGKTLDRIDPFGNYEPDNVRWADMLTQQRNKRNSKSRKTAQSTTHSQMG